VRVGLISDGQEQARALLPRDCELYRLHLDISTHGEVASVKAVTSAPACLGRFLSTDIIFSYSWSTRRIHYEKHCWTISFSGRPHAFGWISSRHCPVVLRDSTAREH